LAGVVFLRQNLLQFFIEKFEALFEIDGLINFAKVERQKFRQQFIENFSP